MSPTRRFRQTFGKDYQRAAQYAGDCARISAMLKDEIEKLKKEFS
jgi:hypothetical protein